MYFWCFLAWCLAPHHETKKKKKNGRRNEKQSPHALSRILSKFYWRTHKKIFSNRSKHCLIIGSFSNGPGYYFGISRFWCVTINYACYEWPNFWSIACLREFFSNKRLFRKSLNRLVRFKFNWKIMMLKSNHDERMYFWIFQQNIIVSTVIIYYYIFFVCLFIFSLNNVFCEKLKKCPFLCISLYFLLSKC